jgi:FtsH-binding integral membrane protein
MEDNSIKILGHGPAVENTERQVSVKNFMATVFSWMAAGLIVSGTAAWLFGNTDLSNLLWSPLTGRTGLGTVVMFAPLAFILIMGFGYRRLSAAGIGVLFMVFSLLMGMSISTIFVVYTQTSIFQIFGVSAAMFGVMAFAGWRTSTDLTRFGSLLMMALVGVIIASIVNFFIGSSSFSYLISFLTVAIFTGLTAYDVQKLKNIAHGEGVEGDASMAKLAVMGALNLYLDFINIFLALLNLFGDRK